MDISNNDIRAMEQHYLDFMKKVRFANCYANMYKENCLRWKSIINATTSILPAALITLISIKEEWLDVLLILAAVATVFEAMTKYFPYEKRVEELSKCICITDGIILELEYTWIQYKHSNHDINFLMDKQKLLCDVYVRSLNENLVQTTYPVRKRAHKRALIKSESQMEHMLKLDEGV